MTRRLDSSAYALPKQRQTLVNTLRRLLAVKAPAQYGGKPLSSAKATIAIKQATQLVEAAEVLSI